MIERVGSIAPIFTPKTTQPTQATDFAKALGNAMNQLQEVQANADDLATKLATGQNVDLHDVTIAAEEASLTFQLAIQMRNKAVEAYQEIMRIQV